MPDKRRPMGSQYENVHRSHGSLDQWERRARGSANFCKLALRLHCTCAELATLQSGKQLRAEQGKAAAGGSKENCRVGSRGAGPCVGCLGSNRPCHTSVQLHFREGEDGRGVGVFKR